MKRIFVAMMVVVLAAACGPPQSGTATVAADRGARLYGMHCLSCHQRDGRGLGELQPALVGSAVLSGDTASLISWVAFGDRPAGMTPRRSVVVMPQFTWLSDDDLAALLSHARSNFANGAAPVSATEVAQVRAARSR